MLRSTLCSGRSKARPESINVPSELACERKTRTAIGDEVCELVRKFVLHRRPVLRPRKAEFRVQAKKGRRDHKSSTGHLHSLVGLLTTYDRRNSRVYQCNYFGHFPQHK